MIPIGGVELDCALLRLIGAPNILKATSHLPTSEKISTSGRNRLFCPKIPGQLQNMVRIYILISIDQLFSGQWMKALEVSIRAFYNIATVIGKSLP
jgi:hypothetical protein